MTITLTTDFGLADAYVAAMKGVILGCAPSTQLVDITHLIPPQDIAGAQVVLRSAWRHFPEKTVHLCIVDPGVGTDRAGLISQAAGHFFVGPDNGCFGFVSKIPGSRHWTIRTEALSKDPSPTFHGRDVFAPVAAKLAIGVSPDSLGIRCDTIRRLTIPEAEVHGQMIRGKIVAIDRFGNLVTNVENPRNNAPGKVRFRDHEIGPIRRVYSDVGEGQTIALWNSDDVLEIAVRNGSAANQLGSAKGEEISVHYE